MECTLQFSKFLELVPSFFVSGKGSVCAHEEPMDKMKSKVISKADMLDKLDRGMSMAMVKWH
jgi:hypothetical protein